MIISPQILRRELVSLLTMIDSQIKEVEKEADRIGIRPEQLRDEYGNWPMVSLLSAKIHALAALAQLNKKER